MTTVDTVEMGITNIISVEYPRKNFDEKIKSPSNFYRLLSNSKISLPNGINNRIWWKNISPKGVYKFKINENVVEITLVLSTNMEINQTEIKCRLKKLGVSAIKIYQSEEEKNAKIKSLGLYNREGFEIFGKKS